MNDDDLDGAVKRSMSAQEGGARAVLSPCGTYRYSLERWWDPDRPPLVWVMLNPSTADATVDDPTIRRCVGFTRREGVYGGLVVKRKVKDPARADGWARAAESITQNPAGAPPLDWWQITTGGYPGAHYATWPGELCERPIDAMCPRRVCRTCGTPSRREVESERYGVGPAAEALVHDPVAMREYAERYGAWAAGKAGGRQSPPNVATTYTTTGWSTCGCPGTDGVRLDGFHTGDGWRPGVVLDPFSGSATTLETAAGRSRDAIGIDLDPRNLTLAERRLGWLLTDVVDHRGQGAA